MANGKLYPGGVNIATSFEMNDPQPIVSYMVVDTTESRDALPNQFDGMDTYVVETGKKYYKSEGVWLEFASNTPLNLAQVTAEGSQTLVTIQSPDAVNANDLATLGQVETITQDLVDNSFRKNIFFTTSLANLGLTDFDQLTNEIVKDWIISLAIVESDEFIYYYEVTEGSGIFDETFDKTFE